MISDRLLNILRSSARVAHKIVAYRRSAGCVFLKQQAHQIGPLVVVDQNAIVLGIPDVFVA
jgi:hypothetical protein